MASHSAALSQRPALTILATKKSVRFLQICKLEAGRIPKEALERHLLTQFKPERNVAEQNGLSQWTGPIEV